MSAAASVPIWKLASAQCWCRKRALKSKATLETKNTDVIQIENSLATKREAPASFSIITLAQLRQAPAPTPDGLQDGNASVRPRRCGQELMHDVPEDVPVLAQRRDVGKSRHHDELLVLHRQLEEVA